MKKFYEKFKKHYLLFAFIVLYIIIPIVLSLACYIFANGLEFVTQNVITIISGILAYIGTTVLGLVTVWQNRQSVKVNERLMRLQRSEFEKNKSSIIRLKDTANFEKYSLNQDFFEKCKAIPQSFFILHSDNFDIKDLKKQYLKADFYFDSVGHELNQIKIEKVVLKSEGGELSFLPFKMETNTGYTFEFSQEAFKLSLLLFDNSLLTTFKKLVESDTLLFEMQIVLISKANIFSSLFLSINLKEFSATNKIKNCLYFYNKDSIDRDEPEP